MSMYHVAVANGKPILEGSSLDISLKDTKEILKQIQQKIDLQECRYEDIDFMQQSSLNTTNRLNASIGNSVVDFKKLKCYRVVQNQNSEIYYKYFVARYQYHPFVYIFWETDRDTLSSNCALLSFELIIMRGIRVEDIESESPQYKIFAAHLECYEKAVTS